MSNIPNQEIETEDTDNRVNQNTGLTDEQEQKIINDINKEYRISFDFLQSKRQLWLDRLKLYNNQKRDPDAVGDPLLFTVFQTVFSSLYTDRLSVNFGAREEGDHEQAENANVLAKYDYDLMEKDEIDYDWIWDTMFFGDGYCLLWDFDRRKDFMAPIPEVWDPTVTLRDPEGTSVNGNAKGDGAWRFFGREILKTKWQLKAEPAYFDVDDIQEEKTNDSMIDEAQEARAEAKGHTSQKTQKNNIGANQYHQLLEWWTHIDGEKTLVTLANGRKKIVRLQKLGVKKWPLIDRKLFPVSHESSSVSVPDLIEDKQRARAILINLGLKSAKADVMPKYLFDKKKVTNIKDLDFAVNKHVEVKGDPNNAIVPMQKSTFHQQVNLILQILDLAAQKAVAAPEVAQGVQPAEKRTLGEVQEVSASASVRLSLGARVFGWSERRFWQRWYWQYKKHFKSGVSKKSLRLQGPLGPMWKEMFPEDILMELDPDIEIESKSMAEQRRAQKFQEFSVFSQIILQDPEIGANSRRYAYRKTGRILDMSTQEINLMIPASIDEMDAEQENERIADNKLPQVSIEEDDAVHIEIHNKAPDTPAKRAHIEAHKFQMRFKRSNPQLFQQPQLDISPVDSPDAPQSTGPDQRTSIQTNQTLNEQPRENQPAQRTA